MTHRERILAAIRGDVPDRLPWLPRLEFWYRAKLRDGTLPPEFRGLTLMEITYRLGIAYYAILGVPAGLPAERETSIPRSGSGASPRCRTRSNLTASSGVLPTFPAKP